MKFSNEFYSIEIDEQTGKIISLTNGKKEFIKEQMPMVRMSLRDMSGTEFRINSDMADFVEIEEKAMECDIRYSIGEEFEIFVKAEFSEEIKWFVNVINKTEKAIEWVSQPGFLVPKDMIADGGKSKILWGFNEGAVIEDIDYREKGFGYKEPGYPGEGLMPIFPGLVQMQCMAYYDGENGLYFATHDNMNNLKSFDFKAVNDAIEFDIRLFTGIGFGEDYLQEYPFVMKMFSGEWQTATEIYREWFEENRRDSFKKINENKVIPDWYKESPVVITYPVRGIHDMDVMTPNKMFPYMNAMVHIERLSKALDSKIMVILMHWEGTAPWAPPYVWPPYGGEECLKEFIEELHKRGDLIGVYCSGIGWTEQSHLIDEYNRAEDYKKLNLEKAMCVSPEGKVEKSHICDCIRSGYDFCPTQNVIYEILEKELTNMVNADIDYVQILDQNHGGNSYFCYGREHGHPPMPGKWQVDAMKKLLGRLKEITNEKKVLLGCESAAAESYIPELLFSDNRYELCYNVGKPVPMYGYLYHEYLNNFSGNQVSTNWYINCNKSPESLCMRIAHSFIAGDMLTLILNDSGEITWNWGWQEYENIPNQENVIKLVRNLNGWRKKYPEYLVEGKMVQSYEVLTGKHIVYQREDYEMPHDDLYWSAWSDGKNKAQFIVNYNSEEKECKVKFDKTLKAKIITDEGCVVSDVETLDIKIKPLSAIMIEVKE